MNIHSRSNNKAAGEDNESQEFPLAFTKRSLPAEMIKDRKSHHSRNSLFLAPILSFLEKVNINLMLTLNARRIFGPLNKCLGEAFGKMQCKIDLLINA